MTGVIFMGTPHGGGNGTEAAVFVTNIVKAANIDLNQDLIKGLQKDSKILFDATRDFRKLVEKTHIKVYTLYEGAQTKLGWGPFQKCVWVRWPILLFFASCSLITLSVCSDRRRSFGYPRMCWRGPLRNNCRPHQYVQIQRTW